MLAATAINAVVRVAEWATKPLAPRNATRGRVFKSLHLRDRSVMLDYQVVDSMQIGDLKWSRRFQLVIEHDDDTRTAGLDHGALEYGLIDVHAPQAAR